MGLVNAVVPLAELERETVRWCRDMLVHSPTALRCLKAALNADCDGQAGIAGAGRDRRPCCSTRRGKRRRAATRSFEKRTPDFSKFPPPLLRVSHSAC